LAVTNYLSPNVTFEISNPATSGWVRGWVRCSQAELGQGILNYVRLG